MATYTKTSETPEAAQAALVEFVAHCAGWGVDVTSMSMVGSDIEVTTATLLPEGGDEHLGLTLAN